MLAPYLGAAALAVSLPACDTDGDLGKDSGGDSAGDDGGDSADSDTGSDSDTGADTAGSDSGDSGGSDGSGGTAGVACEEADCGPAPGADPMCPDGSSAVWTCIDSGNGCGWQDSCPSVEPCTDEECGPAPGAPAQLCPDGVNYSGPGACERSTDGTCGYGWVECPPCCDPTMLPDCPEPITCCADGSYVCGEASACPDGAAGLDCQNGDMCSDVGQSCADGQNCCDGTVCCEGVPVPVGEEYCDTVCPMSDRNLKENFATVDVDAVLDSVSALDISTWNYTYQDPKFRHLGPMAQDFKAAFDIGHTDKAIFQVDADGVALASIQALHTHVKTLESENAELKKTLAAMEKRLANLETK